MKDRSELAFLFAATAVMSLAPPARASEGALGRPITGLQGTSYAGVVPATPGFSTSLSYAYYDGKIGREREAPLGGGGSALGLEVTAQLYSATGIYVWDTGEGAWNFAPAVVLPFANIEAGVDLRIGSNSASAHQTDFGLFDMAFVPVMAGYHFSKTSHLSLALYVFAPTGTYSVDNLAQLSLNNWTFSPTVGYTRLLAEGSVELSALSAVDFYTENKATDYQNGAVFRTDALAVKRFKTGWGIGAMAGWIQQLEDDDGTTADRLGGFQGRSLGIGPLLTYTHSTADSHVEVSARWIHEFDVKNRLQGDPLMLSAMLQF